MKTSKGIIMVAITALFCIFCACSQDDDMYDNSDMYTLAEEMGTRSMGGDPGGASLKKKVYWSKKDSGHNSSPSGILDPINMSAPASLPNSSDLILYGEYDTATLTISISNFVGHAAIYIHSVESGSLMSSDTIPVPSGSPVDFPLSGYATGVNYEIDVALSDSSAYVGLFDL